MANLLDFKTISRSGLTDKHRYEIKKKAMSLYMRNRYKEVCDFIDGVYGWNAGELNRKYTKEEAQWCLQQI